MTARCLISGEKLIGFYKKATQIDKRGGVMLEEIFNRRSMRNFTGKPVSEEQVTHLIKAAMAAPSAGNEQPWEFIIIRDRTVLEKIIQVNPFSQMLKEAPVAIVVCADIERKKYPDDYWVLDCAAATQNILLAATGLGLGSCWLGFFPQPERVEGLRSILGSPEHIVPFSVVAIGYPANPTRPSKRFDELRIHLETW